MAHMESEPRKGGYVIKVNDFGLGVSHQTGLMSQRKADFILSDIKTRVRSVRNGEVKGFNEWTREGRKNFLIHGSPNGPGATPDELKLSKAVEQYLDRDIAHTTRKTYKTELQAAVDFFGESKCVDDIRKSDLQDWISGKSAKALAKLKSKRNGQPLDQVSVKKRIGRLKQLFIWLDGRDELKADPESLFRGLVIKRAKETKFKRDLDQWETPAERQTRIEHLIRSTDYWHESDLIDERAWSNVFLTPEDTKDLIEWVENLYLESMQVYQTKFDPPEVIEKVKAAGDYVIGGHESNVCYFKYDWNAARLWGSVVFAAYTGCRRSEIVRFRRNDVDFKAGTVLLRRMKGRGTDQQYNPHLMPLVEPLRDFLNYFVAYRPHQQCVFCDNDFHFEDGEFQEDRVANKANRLGVLIRRALEDYKYPCLAGFHMYRHGLISQLHSDGHTLEQIAAVIGHQTSEITKIYTHESLRQKMAAAGAMMSSVRFDDDPNGENEGTAKVPEMDQNHAT